jgi:hypothetical protein
MRKFAATMMKTTGASVMPSTQPMPKGVAMLILTSPANELRRITLKNPMRGWSRNNQPMAGKKVGINKLTVMPV